MTGTEPDYRAPLEMAVEALGNSCDLLDKYISTFGDLSEANAADLDDYRSTLTTIKTALETK